MGLALMIRPKACVMPWPDPELAKVAPLSTDAQANQCLAAILLNADAGIRWLDRPEPCLGELRALLLEIVRDGHKAAALLADRG